MTASLYSPGGLPAPDLDDEPNIPADIMALAVALDPVVEVRFTTTLARDQTWAAPVAPINSRCLITSTGKRYLRWLDAASAPVWYETRDGAIVVTDQTARLALPTASMPEGFAVHEDSTKRRFRYAGSSLWHFASGPAPALMVRRTTNGALTPGGWTAFTWESIVAAESVDTSGTSMWVIGTPNRLYARIDGQFQLVFNAMFTSGVAGTRHLGSARNGVVSAGGIRRGNGHTAATGEGNDLEHVTTWKLAAGDYVECMYFASAASDAAVASATELSPRAELRWIGNY